MRTRSSSARAVFSASAGASPRTLIGASMMFWRTVMCGKRLNDWKTMPTRVRRAERLTPGCVSDSPRTMSSPSWIGSSAFTQRISVLLPDPDGPHTTTTSPAWTARVISRRTWSFPNHLVARLNSITASAIGVPILVGDVGDVGDAGDQQGVDALRGEPRVDLPDLVAERDPVAPARARDLDGLDRVAEGRDEFHRVLSLHTAKGGLRRHAF